MAETSATKDYRTRYLIWGLAALVIVVYLALGLAALASQRSSVPPPKEALTAKEAYAQAQAAALDWREDARLLSVTAAWSQATEKDLATGETSWGFYFLSPLARQVQIFSVTEEGATGIKTINATHTEGGIDPSQWQVDSPEAIRLFLANGGREFLAQHPGAAVNLRLAQEESGLLFWMASGLSSQDKATFSLALDAASGEVVKR